MMLYPGVVNVEHNTHSSLNKCEITLFNAGIAYSGRQIDKTGVVWYILY